MNSAILIENAEIVHRDVSGDGHSIFDGFYVLQSAPYHETSILKKGKARPFGGCNVHHRLTE